MSNLNRITLIGNVGADPEYVAFESGAMLTKFPIAVGRYDKRKKQDSRLHFWCRKIIKRL